MKDRGDVDGDGHPDLLWRHHVTGENIVWYLTDVAYRSYAYLDSVTDTAWQLGFEQYEATREDDRRADFNQDGHPDLLWRNLTSGRNILWSMYNTTYVRADDVDTVTPTTWRSVASGDLNDDSWPDIVWREVVTGQTLVWFMQGALYRGTRGWIRCRRPGG